MAIRFGSVRFGSVRFGSVQIDSVRFGSDDSRASAQSTSSRYVCFDRRPITSYRVS